MARPRIPEKSISIAPKVSALDQFKRAALQEEDEYCRRGDGNPLHLQASRGWVTGISTDFDDPTYTRFCYPLWEDLAAVAYTLQTNESPWVAKCREFIQRDKFNGYTCDDVKHAREKLVRDMPLWIAEKYRASLAELVGDDQHLCAIVEFLKDGAKRSARQLQDEEGGYVEGFERRRTQSVPRGGGAGGRRLPTPSHPYGEDDEEGRRLPTPSHPYGEDDEEDVRTGDIRSSLTKRPQSERSQSAPRSSRDDSTADKRPRRQQTPPRMSETVVDGCQIPVGLAFFLSDTRVFDRHYLTLSKWFSILSKVLDHSTITSASVSLPQLTEAAEKATIVFGKVYREPELSPIEPDETLPEIEERQCCDGVAGAAERGVRTFLKTLADSSAKLRAVVDKNNVPVMVNTIVIPLAKRLCDPLVQHYTPESQDMIEYLESQIPTDFRTLPFGELYNALESMAWDDDCSRKALSNASAILDLRKRLRQDVYGVVWNAPLLLSSQLTTTLCQYAQITCNSSTDNTDAEKFKKRMGPYWSARFPANLTASQSADAISRHFVPASNR